MRKRVYCSLLAAMLLVCSTLVSATAADVLTTSSSKAVSTVFSIANNPGQTSVTKSGSFNVSAGQTLTIRVTSNITGGTVDLFLFSPSGSQQRISLGGQNTSKTMSLTKGTWAYNCTGFFSSGNILITGDVNMATNTLKQADGARTVEEPTLNATAADLTEVFNIKNALGQTSVAQSGAFNAHDGQTLTFNISSTIQDGTVDLFLFSPSGTQQRIPIVATSKTNTVTLSEGTWAYNCTGFFSSGSITITGLVNGQGGETPDTTSAFSISNNPGQTNVTTSGSFSAKAGQILTIKIESTIVDGTVDLFLFSPNGKQQKITIGATTETKTIPLSTGKWAYNCTGFFASGNINILGTL